MATKSLIESISNMEQKLHRVAYRLLQNEMEVEDAVQDAIFNRQKHGNPRIAMKPNIGCLQYSRMYVSTNCDSDGAQLT